MSLTGFATTPCGCSRNAIEASLTLRIQDIVRISFQMAVGSTSETLSVNASDVNFNTSDGSVSTVVTAEMVRNMPLNGRSFQDLILLTPGVVAAQRAEP